VNEENSLSLIWTGIIQTTEDLHRVQKEQVKFLSLHLLPLELRNSTDLGALDYIIGSPGS
jgi:hypothetical protein